MMMTKNTFNNLLTNRNFLFLWLAYAISVLGDHISELAILKLHGGLNIGVDITPLQAKLTFLFMLPFFVFGPFMGLLADRFPRKFVMVFADIVRALIMFAFYWLISFFSQIEGWGTFVPVCFIGIFAAMFSPARSSMVPMIVKPDQLVRANTMISAIGIIVAMFSVLISGYLADRYNPGVSFKIDGVTFIISAVILLNLRIKNRHKRQNLKNDIISNLAQVESNNKVSRNSLSKGFKYIFSHKRVLQLIILATLFWTCGSFIRSVIPAIVKDVYKGTFQEIAFFQVWLGLGLVSGAIAINIFGATLRSGITITWGFIGAGFNAIILFCTIFFNLHYNTAHFIGACAIYGMGFFGVGISIGYNALLQRIVPNKSRGRIFGILDMCTVFGLLVSTGILAIPNWPHLDKWVGYIVFFAAFALTITGIISFIVQLSAGKLPFLVAFIFNLNEILCKTWYGFKMIGKCTVPQTGPIILVANHLSTIDPAILCAAIKYRCPSFLIAKEYSNIPVLRFFFKLVKCIPVQRNSNDINATKETLRYLRDGRIVTIFIQGGIRANGQRGELKNGAAILALRTGATVIPAYISGTVHRGIIADIFCRHKARIKFGDAVDLVEFTKNNKNKQSNITLATEKIYSRIMALSKD